LDSIRSQLNPVHTFTSYLLTINPRIILVVFDQLAPIFQFHKVCYASFPQIILDFIIQTICDKENQFQNFRLYILKPQITQFLKHNIL